MIIYDIRNSLVEMEELFDILENETSVRNMTNDVPEMTTGDVFRNVYNTHKVVRKEKVFVNGNKQYIRRVFIRLPQSIAYRNVGWVLYIDVNTCMVCCKRFLPLVSKRQKFHCKTCGNIVCVNCLTGLVKIKEFHDFGYFHACSNCFWGQVLSSINICTYNIYYCLIILMQDEISVDPFGTSGSSKQGLTILTDVESEEIAAQKEEMLRQAKAEEDARNIIKQEIEAGRARAKQLEEEEAIRRVAMEEEKRRQREIVEQMAKLEAEALEQARLIAEAEDRARREAERQEAAKRKAEEEELERQKKEKAEADRVAAAAEEVARLWRESEEQARLKAEQLEAARLKAIADEEARLKAEVEERLRIENENAMRLEEAREMQRLKMEAEERARIQAEAEEKIRIAAEAEAALLGKPVAVMKSHRSDNSKIFINLLTNINIQGNQVIIAKGCPRVIGDREGDMSLVYDVGISNECISHANTEQQRLV